MTKVILHQSSIKSIIRKAARYRGGVVFFQKHIAERHTYRKQLGQEMNQYWDSTVAHYMQKAQDLGNDELVALCAKIEDISAEIKDFVIKAYLTAVFRLSWIQYYQKRRKKLHSEEDIKMVDDEVAKYESLILGFLKMDPDAISISEEAINEGNLSEDQYLDLDLDRNYEYGNGNLVQNPISIGWDDPFENVEFSPLDKREQNLLKRRKKTREQEDLKAAEQAAINFLKAEYVPSSERIHEAFCQDLSSIKLPNKIMLFNAMRASVFAEKVEQLWIFRC